MPLGKYSDGPPFDEPFDCVSVVGMLVYISRKSRPDIQFAVHHCSRSTHNPSRIHDESVNRICRYLVGNQGHGLTFDPNSDMKLDFYVDAYFLGIW